MVLYLTEEIRKKETLHEFSRLLGFSRVIRALQYANFFKYVAESASRQDEVNPVF